MTGSWSSRLALAVVVLLVPCASASAAITRVQVDWSGPPEQDHSPYVNIFQGGYGGQYAGPCDARDQNCASSPGFHWEEGNFDARGFAHLISYIDDQPEQARRICFELQHPYDTTLPFGGTMQVTVTVTDPDNSQRTVQFALAKGQRSAVECSPVKRPAGGTPGDASPPSWWGGATKFVRSRGGTCDQEVTQRIGRDPDTGRESGTYQERFSSCRHRIPKAVFVALGGNPNSPVPPAEGCTSIVQQGNPNGDEHAWSCNIFAAPGTEAKPNRAPWRCSRSKYVSRLDSENQRFWEASRTKLWPERRVATLAACLGPRAAFDTVGPSVSKALSGGLAVPFRCSKRCTVDLRLSRRGATLAQGRERLRAAVEKSVQATFGNGAAGRLAGARRLKLTATVTAGAYKGRATETVMIDDSKLKLAGPNGIDLKR
jgi:hypothetical protein